MLSGGIADHASGHHQPLILEPGKFCPELFVLFYELALFAGVFVDLVALFLYEFGHLLDLLFELAVFGVDFDDDFFVGWISMEIHWVMSESRFSLVMISEVSLELMSFWVISSVLFFFWWICSS